ncbi:hypothetical protein [Thermanaeromonas sp. C210]|uniref:hypothetical protein n=1 Tax=Thermanaeromonas sp. C210 TaxID=2731925 RepID=UPI00155C65ED|nr:hypothetical protein [Thermanaeromonas sp. C210]GFN23740.1 hypothetical protein TAMC210_20570 [Thermanaeromonas sp. C210]
MRLVFFAAANAQGYHCFCNWDMHECLPEESWHFYRSGGKEYPSSSGLSVKWVSEIAIYSQISPPAEEAAGQALPEAAPVQGAGSGEGRFTTDPGVPAPEERRNGEGSSPPETEVGTGGPREELATVGISVEHMQVAPPREVVRLINSGTAELEVYLAADEREKGPPGEDSPLIYVNGGPYDPSRAIGRVPPAGALTVAIELKGPYPENMAEEVCFLFWARPLLDFQ